MTEIHPNLVKSGQTFESLLAPKLEKDVLRLIPRTLLYKFSFREYEILFIKNKIKSPIFQELTNVLRRRKEITQSKNLLNSVKTILGKKKLFFNYHIAGATTGRTTTSKENIQGVPHFLRLGMVPYEGNIFVVADVSQEEVRIMAEISKDPSLLKIFKES